MFPALNASLHFCRYITLRFIQLVKVWVKLLNPLYITLNLNNIKYLYLHFIDVVQLFPWSPDSYVFSEVCEK